MAAQNLPTVSGKNETHRGYGDPTSQDLTVQRNLNAANIAAGSLDVPTLLSLLQLPRYTVATAPAVVVDGLIIVTNGDAGDPCIAVGVAGTPDTWDVLISLDSLTPISAT